MAEGAASAAKPRREAHGLRDMMGKVVAIITNDGKEVIGKMVGFDQNTNVILNESHERVYSKDKGVEEEPWGLYVVRGDNVAIVGLVDQAADAARDLSQVRGESLPPVRH